LDILAEHFLDLMAMTALLFCSAFFSGTETALFSLSREQVRHLRGKGRQVGKLLDLLAGNPSGLLVAILFGNLIVNILFFCISVVFALDIGRAYGEWWEAVIGISVLVLIILLGEIMPKAISLSFPERVVRLNSFPLTGWFHFIGPVRRVLELATRHLEPRDQHDNRLNAEELKMLIEATHHDPSFGMQEKAIVEDIVNLPEIRVRELMTPRVQQMFRNADTPVSEVMADAAEREIERIPVYEGDEDNIIGVADVRELFACDDTGTPLSYYAQPVRFVPETKRADQMLREFLAEELHMVCVVDEYGGLAGTVCMEDILEEVVGDFNAMEASEVEQLGESVYRLQGSLGIREWRNLFVGFLPDEVMRSLALDTLSGLVVSLLKRMPEAGDVAQVGNLRFTVEQVKLNRIESVLLELVTEREGGAS
jgi:CBS domain containing-hemolysin-like protein